MNSTALNYLGASDKAIKLSFFSILMRAFRYWLNELHSFASPCFHAVPFFVNNWSNKKNQFIYPEWPFLYFVNNIENVLTCGKKLCVAELYQILSGYYMLFMNYIEKWRQE